MSSGFISEADLAERRRVRNELWQNTRGENDPDEPPEEAETLPDHRTLYERLQEQKLKKQEDWEEAHKLKNMVRGLEDDEVDFLEMVDNTKLQEEKRIKEEEDSVLKDYRKKVSEMQQKTLESVALADLKSESKKSCQNLTKKSPLSLVAGAIKRKSSYADNEGSKKANIGQLLNDNGCITSTSVCSSANTTKESNEFEQQKVIKKAPTALECVAILPGLGSYSDSSDSDNDSNSDMSDLENHVHQYISRDLTGRIIKLSNIGSGDCC